MKLSGEIGIDLIRELRLRQWARAHFVPSSQRAATWHPIVLDEMSRRDDELQQSSRMPIAGRSSYVPLAPTSKDALAEAS